MGSQKLVLALYRSLLRNAKVFDLHNEFKALLPREIEWNGGTKRCDFYSSGASCVHTIRQEFRTPKDASAVQVALDEAIELNKATLERVQLLYTEENLLTFADPPHRVSFDEKYQEEKAKQPKERAEALENALQLIQSASQVLQDDDMQAPDKARVAKTYYQESIRNYPTADAHAYLGWHYYLDGELDKAVVECERAIELDPAFGNSYNDLGLIRVHQGQEEEAITLFAKAKVAPRNDVRHFPSLNLAALYLEQNRVKPALHEYIQALHWMGPEEAVPIRNTVTDMGTFMVTMADKMRSAE